MNKQTVKLNFLRMAPRKVRAIAGLMRGMPVAEAEAQLMHERRRPAKPLLKLLRSAMDAAKTIKKMNPDKLVIESIAVDQGPMLRRSLPRARGVATMIQKKMSHVTLTLVEKSDISPRFNIIIKKKAKKSDSDQKPSRKKRETPANTAVGEGGEAKEREQKQHPGFFRRVFRRKSV